MITLILLAVAVAAVIVALGFALDAVKHEGPSNRAVMAIFLIGWVFFALKIGFRILDEVAEIKLLDEPFSIIYSTLVMLFFLTGMYLLAKKFKF